MGFENLMSDADDGMLERITQLAATRAAELKAIAAETQSKKKRKKGKEMIVSEPIIANPKNMEEAIEQMQTSKANWYAFAIAALGPEDISVDDALHIMGLDRKNNMSGKYAKSPSH